MTPTPRRRDYCRSIGRDGAEYYNKLGYVPYSSVRGEPSFAEATAKTLEYAYDDFCAARLARAIGRQAEAEQFARKAMNYTNLFDAKTGFMRGRKADGSWCEPFDPTEWGGPFTEGCSWHWTWSVMQDIPGLIKLMGGEKAFAAKLDAVFTSPNTFKAGTYGSPIHEMTEMAALDMGQYAHGNEPVHHMIYLYDYVGQPWKTQSRIRLAMTQLYQATPDGLCGDEDTGQMSAWYVFSALGFYPVCPGDTAYCHRQPPLRPRHAHAPRRQDLHHHRRAQRPAASLHPRRQAERPALRQGLPHPRATGERRRDRLRHGLRPRLPLGHRPRQPPARRHAWDESLSRVWGARPPRRSPPAPSPSGFGTLRVTYWRVQSPAQGWLAKAPATAPEAGALPCIEYSQTVRPWRPSGLPPQPRLYLGPENSVLAHLDGPALVLDLVTRYAGSKGRSLEPCLRQEQLETKL